ncbi:MAG: HAD-IC family P-type ATPase [Candidatus Staskawiczbacteria bacterium]|nr:HAD-IC family P-type ATPase [Candidatus Staskawiczbacteria bacterium]
MNFSEYTNKNIEEVSGALETSFAGLSKKEVVLRQEKFGFNEIKSNGVSALKILKRQLKSPFTYLLFLAAIIAFFVGEKIDFFVITTAVVINVAIGFFQEYRAERAIFFLKKYISQSVKVLRQSKEETVNKKDLVPGDVVLLQAGDRVPADLRIIKTENFLADESSLTGESVPVAKTVEPLSSKASEVFKAKNILFAGTSVVSGKAEGFVINTGKNTAFGEIAEMILNGTKESSYEKSIMYFCKLVLRIVVITITLLFAANLLIKGVSNFLEFSLFCVALIVSILPEALPAVVTFSLSRGSLKMAKRHVVVRRLSAIEDLGNIEILCTDKTGTLTENKLSLQKIVSSDKRKCLLYGLLSSNINDRKQSILNPFDLALFDRSPDDFWREYKKYDIVYELPFDSSRMRSSFVVKNKKGEKFLIVKGAPEVLLNLCSKAGGKSARKEIEDDTKKEGLDGKRVLALAYKKIPKDVITKEDEKRLSFLGYFVFEDPLKNTAQEALRIAKKLGLKIKVITGDSKEVAGYVAKKIKLINNTQDVVSADELEKMMPDEFEDACIEKQVFARISPELKYKIVKSLQKRYDVGFLGEGINDAPALKISNVAIVVQSASDVSREVSDVVLLKKDLRVIVEAIKSGRNIYSNINKYIKCTLASNFGNFYSIAVISLFIKFLPMLPSQILLANLLTDFPLIAVATDSVDTEELKKPKMYKLNSVLPLIIALAMISTVFDFIFFALLRNNAPAVIQTLWFIESVLTELILIFLVRTMHPAWKAKKPSFPLVFLSVLAVTAVIILPFLGFGQRVLHFVTPPIAPLIVVLLLISAYAVLSEITKLIYFKYFRKADFKIIQSVVE